MTDPLVPLCRSLGLVARQHLVQETGCTAMWRRQSRSPSTANFSRGVLRSSGTGVLPEQQWALALLRAGEGGLLTGEIACALYGLRSAGREVPTVVLVGAGRCARGGGGIVRTARPPAPVLLPDAAGRVWPCAPLRRAVADGVRRRDVVGARDLVAEALRTGRVTRRQLDHELRAIRGRPGPSVRTVLRDLAVGGTWSVGEGELLDLFTTSSVLPPPRVNLLLVDQYGNPVARPDFLFEEAALVCSLDSRQFHEEVARWSETLETALVLETLGLLVVNVTPSMVSARPRETLLVVERHYLER